MGLPSRHARCHCDPGLFFLGVVYWRTPRKNSPEVQGAHSDPSGHMSGPSHGTGVGKPRAAAHRDRHSDFSCMQVSITQLILRISPPAEYEFRIPVFHIHVPRYCAYGKLRAAGDSETLDLTCS